MTSSIPNSSLTRRDWLGIAASSLSMPALAQFASERTPGTSVPQVKGPFGSLPGKFLAYDVVLTPDRDEPEWWAGAPSVVRDRAGIFWMAARMRNANPAGNRGYELRLLRSADGARFETVKRIGREQVGIPGFERPALVEDPRSKKLWLFGCGRWKSDRDPWVIFAFDPADRLADVNPASARPVIVPRSPANPRDFPVSDYKDPVIVFAEGSWHCWVIGVMRGVERTYHFTSADGALWQPAGDPYQPVMDLAGWHRFAVRPASVMPLPAGYLFVYEGSDTNWHDANYNIATGLAFTFDLHHLIDLTPDSPLVVSSTPGPMFHTWRYSSWLWVEDEWWVYAEVARPNRTNEIRRFRLRRGAR